MTFAVSVGWWWSIAATTAATPDRSGSGGTTLMTSVYELEVSVWSALNVISLGELTLPP